MPAPYSTDLRQRVIEAHSNKEGSQRQLAERFKVSESFVKRLLRRYRETGQIESAPHGGGAQAKIGYDELGQVQQLVVEQPDALLFELCERLEKRSGTKVSVPTMHRAVHRLKLTTKKNSVCE